MTKWAFIENICILAAVCFLVWLTGSGCWVLLTLMANSPKSEEQE